MNDQKNTKQISIDDLMKAPSLAEAKRMLAEMYAAANPTKAATLKFERRQAGLYDCADGETIFKIVEVPETKGQRYSWNVLKNDKLIGNVELLSQAKALAEQNK